MKNFWLTAVSGIAVAALTPSAASAVVNVGFDLRVIGANSGSLDQPRFELQNTSTFGSGDAASSAFISQFTLNLGASGFVIDRFFNPSFSAMASPQSTYVFAVPNGGSNPGGAVSPSDPGNTSNDAGASATLGIINFGGFNAGETFNFRTDLDPGESNNFRTALNGAIANVTFGNGQTAAVTLNFTGTGTTFDFTGAVPAAAAVPEPATWAMMLLGFGLVGAGARSRREYSRGRLIL